MSTSGSHAAAVEAVNNWVKVSRQGGRISPSTQLFIDDLVAGQNQQKWARTNVDQMIPFRTQGPRLLLVVRAGALFLPILLTWLSLSQVIGPFALFLQNQQASANFLWFWQTNPGKSFGEIYKLSHVALTDAAVLAFLTVLAMRIAWWESARAEMNEHVYIDMLAALENYFIDHR